MKNLLLILFIFFAVNVCAQEVKVAGNVAKLETLVSKYCVVKVSMTMVNKVVHVHVDGGAGVFVEEGKKEKKFGSEAEVLNYMVQNGWELKDAYSDNSFTSFVMYRKE